MLCPACGKDDWVVSEPPDAWPTVTHIPLDPQRVDGPATPVYLLFCQNCGLLRMHDRKLVDDNL